MILNIFGHYINPAHIVFLDVVEYNNKKAVEIFVNGGDLGFPIYDKTIEEVTDFINQNWPVQNVEVRGQITNSY